MPKVSQAHLDARRRQILDAAIECFAREGFHQTIMQDIVTQSALSPGAIYTYFKSKEDIIEAIAHERNGRERDLIIAAQQTDNGAVFHRLIHDFFAMLLADPEERKLRRVGIQAWAEALRSPPILEIVRRGVNEPLALLTEMVTQAQQDHEISTNLSSEAVARVMIAIFQGFLLQQAWDDEVEVAPYIEVVEAIIDGLRANAERNVS